MDNFQDQFTDQAIAQFTTLLSQRTGINLETLNHVNIKEIIIRHIKSFQTQGLEELYIKIIQDPQLFNHLIESIVIPETSFFRHAASFTFLKQYCLEQSVKKSTFRILSVPCSTGEEPYSIAITLLEAGIPSSKITIDAFDISEVAIAKAMEGKYKKYAFRSSSSVMEQYQLKKYFDQRDEFYLIRPEIKSLVNFKQGNLMGSDFLAFYPEYDIIFCRNVLIYFSDLARRQVVQKLYQLLSDQGLLFIGYAEMIFISAEYFKSLHFPQAFAYRKEKKQIISKATTKTSIKTNLPTKQTPSEQQRNLNQKKLTSSLENIKGKIPENLSPPGSLSTKPQYLNQDQGKTVNKLSSIRQLANQGALSAALEACQNYIKEYPTDAGGYLLIGEIYQAKNLDLDAYGAFKKALYLNPECTDSLTHLIFLSEQQSNFKQAHRYRQRLLSKALDEKIDS